MSQLLPLHSVTALVQHKAHWGQAFLPLQPLAQPQSGQGGLSATAKATTPALHSTRGLPHHTCAHQGWRQQAPVWACLAACHLHQASHSGETTPAETTRQQWSRSFQLKYAKPVSTNKQIIKQINKQTNLRKTSYLYVSQVECPCHLLLRINYWDSTSVTLCL